MEEKIEEDKEKKIVSKVVEKLVLKGLFDSLIDEKNPVKIETTLRGFLEVHGLEEGLDIQRVFAFLKNEGLFKKHVRVPGLHNLWIKLRNELAPKFLIEN